MRFGKSECWDEMTVFERLFPFFLMRNWGNHIHRHRFTTFLAKLNRINLEANVTENNQKKNHLSNYDQQFL